MNYSYSLNTPNFAFLDTKSAQDRVSLKKLFLKMVKRGVARYMVVLLRYRYTSQPLFVEWGTALSLRFDMSNGRMQ